MRNSQVLTMMHLISLLSILSCLVFVKGLDLQGKVVWNDVCGNLTSLGYARAVLNEGTFHGSITQNGSFVIPDVPEGTHVLSILSHDYLFDQLRIDVNESWPSPEVRPYVAGTPLNPPSTILLSYPITLVPREKENYFVAPESFSLVAMLSNPMMLMMVFGGIMMIGMPYLTKNMNPEMLEEFKEQQVKMTSMQNALKSGNLKAGISEMMNAGTVEETSNKVPSAATPKGKNSKRVRK